MLRSSGCWLLTLLDRPTINAIVIVAGGSMTVVGFSVAGAAWPDGSITDWMQAIATTAAFIAAGIAARHAASVLDIERRRDADTELTQLQSQAERLAAWGLGESGPHGMSGGDQVWRFAIYLRNSSTLPVYDCKLSVRTEIDVFGEMRTKQQDDLRVAVMPPGDTAEKVTDVTMTLPSSAWAAGRSTTSEDARLTHRAVIDMTFRDTGSRWWRRDEWGTLTGPFAQRPE